MDNESTLQLIPIDTIESIIYDNNTYQSFIERKDEFIDIDQLSYLEAINHYMDYAILHTNDMSKDVFNRVNYLNISLGSSILYDYYHYLDKTQNLVTIDAINKILHDELEFKLFMDFENNIDHFNNIDLLSYLSALNNLVGYYDKVGFSFSDEEHKRIIAIKQKYSLKLRRYVHLEGYQVSPEERINVDLFNSITSSIDLNREPFYIARAVYIRLAKLVTYDPNFIALDQDTNNKLGNEIYNRSISNITLSNNKIICKNWAELYAFILNKLGIRAVVSGDKHKYVTFDCDGTLLKADATNTVTTTLDEFSMPDLARIQCGLPTGGYTCLENDKDISLLLQEVDWELEYHPTSIEERYDELESRYQSIKESEGYEEILFDSLEFLRRVSSNSNLNNFELFKYILALSKPLFKRKHIDDVITYFICTRNESNAYSASCLITYKDNNDYKYIIFSKGTLEPISREELIRRINNNDIKIIGHNTTIIGIDKEITNGITR